MVTFLLIALDLPSLIQQGEIAGKKICIKYTTLYAEYYISD